MKILPDVGGINRLIIFIVVVLPQPDGPSRTHTAPAGTSMSTLSTAVIVPKTLLTRSSRIISVPQTRGGQATLQPEQTHIGDDRQNTHRQGPGDELPDV